MNTKILIISFALVAIISCQVPLSTVTSTTESTLNPAALAARYADDVERAYEAFCVGSTNGRSVSNSNPNALSIYFDNLVIHDDSGKQLKFS